MAPAPRSSMCGSTAWQVWNMLLTLMAMRRFHCASLVSRNGRTVTVPAWLNRRSMCPHASNAAAIDARTSAPTLASVGRNRASLSAARMSRTVCSARSALVSRMATRAFAGEAMGHGAAAAVGASRDHRHLVGEACHVASPGMARCGGGPRHPLGGRALTCRARWTIAPTCGALYRIVERNAKRSRSGRWGCEGTRGIARQGLRAAGRRRERPRALKRRARDGPAALRPRRAPGGSKRVGAHRHADPSAGG